MVKRLRRRPLTAKSAVRVRLEVPTKSPTEISWLFLFVPPTLASLAVASQPADSNLWSRLRRLHQTSIFIRFIFSYHQKAQLRISWLFLSVPPTLASLVVAPQPADSNLWSRLRRLHRTKHYFFNLLLSCHKVQLKHKTGEKRARQGSGARKFGSLVVLNDQT